METLENLDPLLRTFWYIAIPTSLIFVIQTVMTFMGTDATHSFDTDFDGDPHGVDTPYQLFSFRNLVSFLLGFSWSGISFYDSISNRMLLIAISLLTGVAFVGVFFIIIQQIRKLAEDNSFKLPDTLDKIAEVYLTIPESKKGSGKIMISVGGSVHVLDAVTENEKIETGARVRVTRIIDNSFLTVERI
jgi:hypothetical protein